MAEDAEIVEAVKEANWQAGARVGYVFMNNEHEHLATAALSAARPLIDRAARKEALEDAARVAEDYAKPLEAMKNEADHAQDGIGSAISGAAALLGQSIAIAIRALDEGGGK